MKSCKIPFVEDIPCWNKLPFISIDQALWCSPNGISALAQLCWNREALLVRLAAQEPSIRAQETGPLGMPCEDSCLEFFFCPVEEDKRYFNIEFNPNCCLYLGFGSGRGIWYDCWLTMQGNYSAPLFPARRPGGRFVFKSLTPLFSDFFRRTPPVLGSVSFPIAISAGTLPRTPTT